MEPICAIKDIYKILYQFEKNFSEVHAITINEAMLLCCLKDNEAKSAGMISNYFLRPAVSAALKDSYTRVLEHLRTGRVSAADLKQIQKALAFLTPTCQMSREAQRDLMGASLKTTALLSSCR